ncbi:hypothetical protein [Actinomadura miaoliensis]|uniref:Uncharacterized protein n=1 Tax=Actinomadura miaoliensis TaxID=430685 RepID=A0ABP7W1C2_9ACTN
MATPQLSPEEVASLLYDLCVELGFCLSPEDQAALRTSPPTDVDSFAEAVFQAEGMNPSANEHLWHQVRHMVARAFTKATPNP